MRGTSRVRWATLTLTTEPHGSPGTAAEPVRLSSCQLLGAMPTRLASPSTLSLCTVCRAALVRFLPRDTTDANWLTTESAGHSLTQPPQFAGGAARRSIRSESVNSVLNSQRSECRRIAVFRWELNGPGNNGPRPVGGPVPGSSSLLLTACWRRVQNHHCAIRMIRGHQSA